MNSRYPVELDAKQMFEYLLSSQLESSPSRAHQIAYRASKWVRKEVSTWYFDIYRQESSPLPDHLPVLIPQTGAFEPYAVLAGRNQIAEIKRRSERLMWAYIAA